MLQNKSHNEIDDNWTAKCKKGKINEVHAYVGGIDAQFFTPPLANTKSLLLEPSCDLFYHDTNIVNFEAMVKPQALVC